MTLMARKRVSPVDILQIDYEYCRISYYAQDSRNDLGEPSKTLIQRAENVKCSIDPIPPGQTHAIRGLPQGQVEQSTHHMVFPADQIVCVGDIVTDYDGNTYDVLFVATWWTHKEALLRLRG